MATRVDSSRAVHFAQDVIKYELNMRLLVCLTGTLYYHVDSVCEWIIFSAIQPLVHCTILCESYCGKYHNTVILGV